MGRLMVPATGAVYVDSSTVIYRVEGLEPFASASLPIWEALQDGNCQVSTSDLTLLEVLVKPVRDGNLNLVAIYRRVLLETEGLTSIPIDHDILELAAQLRATHRLKTPDSIHAATAIQSGAVLFVTNDTDFRRVPGLNVVILADVAALGSTNGSGST
jgi:predicted nucleic acid-binding protein